MVIYRLNDDQRDELLNQTEYGMGYQLDSDRSYVFLNAEIAIELVDCELMISREDVEQLTAFLLQNDAAQREIPRTVKQYPNDPQVTMHGSYPSQTVQGEKFWRYSAFRNDRRIQPDGSVLPGTYATTENDSELVTSGLGAVGRYALPDPMPARYAYVLQPPSGQEILCGNSAPNFGQAGGGVEILFTQGLPRNSAVTPLLIPER